ncbi:MAG: SPFH domain-containing protein [Myxococcales bacterium]|nr:SPFH domain-containing protein [Myxococcales bacterium]
MKYFLLGASLGALLLPLLAWIARAMIIEVQENEAVLVTRFGKLSATLTKPGPHFWPSRALPWVHAIAVSLRRDFRLFRTIHVNDARGTTVIIDLWVEFRVVDAARATFSVADWDRSLQNLVAHSATSILGNRQFNEILCDRSELGALLQQDIAKETERWGLAVDQVYISKVNLLPEVSRQIFETIAARLERAKADIEETGRLAVAELDARTETKVAALVAESKAQYPLAISRALARLEKKPAVYAAYEELHRLSLLRPHRTVVFRGFDEPIRAIDAAMVSALPRESAAEEQKIPHGRPAHGTH